MNQCDNCGDFCEKELRTTLEVTDSEYSVISYEEGHVFCSEQCVIDFYRQAFLNGKELEEWARRYSHML